MTVDLASAVEAALQQVGALLHPKAALRRELGPLPFVDADEASLVDSLTDLLRDTVAQLAPGGRESNLITIRLVAVGDGVRVEIGTRHLVVAAQPAPPLQGPSARVLLVDDDQDVLRSIQRGLAFQHHVVAIDEARHAFDALVAGEHFDIVLCDLMMPNLSGQELHAALAEVAPDVVPRVVFVTGGACTPATQEFLTRVRSLEKPVTLARIRRIVADAIGDPAGSHR